MTSARFLRGTMYAWCVALATGCTSGAFDSDLPFRQVYMIAAPAATGEIGTVAADVTVSRPTVKPGLDTDRIAVLYPDRRLDYYAGSRWGGSTDLVVQSLLIDTLRRQAGMRNVHGDASLFAGEFVLQADVTHFQAEYSGSGGPPQVNVELVISIGKVPDRRPLAAFTARGTAQADSNTLGSVVSAFESAYAQAAKTVVDRTVSAIAAAGQAEPSAQNMDKPVASISR
jgi:ABC-type uncharacterized transport system auxiliary subunit